MGCGLPELFFTLEAITLRYHFVKKSDIFVAIVIFRSEKPTAEKKIRNGLSLVLNQLSLNLETWDQDVDTVIANGIIKHVGSVKAELSSKDIILDIDTILKTIL